LFITLTKKKAEQKKAGGGPAPWQKWWWSRPIVEGMPGFSCSSDTHPPAAATPSLLVNEF